MRFTIIFGNFVNIFEFLDYCLLDIWAFLKYTKLIFEQSVFKKIYPSALTLKNLIALALGKNSTTLGNKTALTLGNQSKPTLGNYTALSLRKQDALSFRNQNALMLRNQSALTLGSRVSTCTYYLDIAPTGCFFLLVPPKFSKYKIPL